MGFLFTCCYSRDEGTQPYFIIFLYASWNSLISGAWRRIFIGRYNKPPQCESPHLNNSTAESPSDMGLYGGILIGCFNRLPDPDGGFVKHYLVM